jgi:hypothetical protein
MTMSRRQAVLSAWTAAAMALTGLAWAQSETAPSKPRAPAEAGASRQVTLFGVLATPGDAKVDPKLADVAPQLRKLHPGHGFRLLGAKNQRLEAGQSVDCDLGGGVVARTELVHVLDPKGKVQLRFALDADGKTKFVTTVTTPPNQLSFCDKELTNKSRLVIGFGAR